MRRSTAAVGSALFFLLAPGVVVGLVPWALTRWQVREPLPYWAPARVLGGVVLVAGLIALVQAFVRFVVEGHGTRAPVAAPECLVVGGAYRHVRNPMYVAVLAAIVGQALLLGLSSGTPRTDRYRTAGWGEGNVQIDLAVATSSVRYPGHYLLCRTPSI
jgi:protein-S-isoprenylcysteine O-methyltransferase Ste14